MFTGPDVELGVGPKAVGEVLEEELELPPVDAVPEEEPQGLQEGLRADAAVSFR